MSARITIDGNLTADPDFGVSNAGTSWAHLRVASHERVKRNGEWTSTDPEFFNVTAFGKAAEDAGPCTRVTESPSKDARSWSCSTAATAPPAPPSRSTPAPSP